MWMDNIVLAVTASLEPSRHVRLAFQGPPDPFC